MPTISGLATGIDTVRQTTEAGVYSVESPGGWRLLGRKPLRLFDPDPGARRPFLLAPGDGLRFVPVDRACFDALAAGVRA